MRVHQSTSFKTGVLVVPRLIIAVSWISSAAFAQSNSNSFNATMPPMDIISACNQVIDADAGHAQAHLSRGAAWYKLRDYDRAISDFSQAINIDPKYVGAFYGRGLAFEKKGKLEDALADFIYFAKLDPSYPDAQSAVTRVSLALKKSTSATIKTARKGGDAPSACLNATMSPDDVIASCNDEIRADPTKVGLWYNRGNAWDRKHDYDRATADYSEAIRQKPSFMSAYNNRGNMWLIKGDFDRAIADYNEAIKLDPKQAGSFFNRGLAWEKKKDLIKSLADFKHSVELDSSFTGSQQAVARVTAAINGVTAEAVKTEQEVRRDYATPIVDIARGRRLALVIGNDSYQRVPRLEKAVGDADAIAQALKAIGFTVTEANNLSFEQTARQLAEFEGGISTSDIVFFHFSGHGVQIKGDNILLPIDTPQPKDGQQSLVQKFGLSAESVIQSFSEKGASLVVAVLDACRDNPFASSGTRGVGGSRGLAAISPVEGTFVIYSAGVNQTALDRLGNSDRSSTSVFTRVLTPLLQEPNLSLIEIAKRSQVRVRDLARTVGHEQTPAYYDQVIGNVGLVER